MPRASRRRFRPRSTYAIIRQHASVSRTVGSVGSAVAVKMGGGRSRETVEAVGFHVDGTNYVFVGRRGETIMTVPTVSRTVRRVD